MQDTTNESRIEALTKALQSTLWVLEHPEVNAIKFCGNPRGLAKEIRQLLKDEAA